MAQRTVTLSDGRTLTLEVSDDATQEDIISTVNKFLESEKPKIPEIEEEEGPSLGQTVAGLGTEVGIGEGAKLAGALTFGPVGYAIGGIAGGIAGSISAQKIEGQDEISWGRVTADTLLNLIPGGLGKAQKGAKILPRLAKEGTKRAVGGAAIATGAAQVEKAIEEGDYLTVEEFENAAKQGALINVGFGAAGELLKKAYPKFAGKGSDVLNDAYEKGDPDATQIVETFAGENPVGKGSRYKRMILERVYPSKLTGKKVTLDIDRAKNEAEAAREMGVRIKKQIELASKDATDAEKKLLDDYVTNKSADLPERFRGIQGNLNQVREKIDEYQNTLLNLYYDGALKIDERIAQKIEDSVDAKNYFTREYKLYEDPSYVPSVQSTERLKQSLMKDTISEGKRRKGMTSDEANEFVQDILNKRDRPLQLLNSVYGNKRVLRRKKDLSDEMREFLGEYDELEVGEKMFGTMSRLGRLASEEAGNARVYDSLLRNGIAQKFAPGNVPEGYNKLFIRNKEYDAYVPEDINRSLNRLYASGIAKDTGNFAFDLVKRIMATTTSGAKFVLVPLNAASYPVQLIGNMTLAIGQGLNPLGRRYWKDFSRGIKVGYNEALPEKLKSKKLSLKEMTELKELNLVNKGVTATDIKRGFDEGFKGTKFGNVLEKGTQTTGAAYNLFDTAQRLSVFENYKHFLKEIIPEDTIKGMGKDFNRLAADLTNDTYMNYDRVSKNLRALSRYGFLNEFGAFNFELMRTTWNQAKLNKSMIDGSFAKNLEEQYNIKLSPDAQSKIAKEGGIRTGLLASMLGVASVGKDVFNKTGGVDEEEEEALRDIVFAPWEQDQALHIRRDGDKVRLANISYQFPVAELTSVVEGAQRGETFTESMYGMIDSLWSKIGGEGITINLKNFAAFGSGFDPDTGRRISTRERGSLPETLDLAVWYLGETFTPGTIRDFKKISERETNDNILRYTLGYRVRNASIDEAAGYKLRNINTTLNDIRGRYSREAKDVGNLAREYNIQNNIYRQTVERGIKNINSLRTLGYTDEQILALGSKRKVRKSLMEEMMRGEVKDMQISPTMPRGAKNKEERVKKYIDVSQKLPPDMVMKMLREDFANKKIKAPEVKAIMGALKMQQALSE